MSGRRGVTLAWVLFVFLPPSDSLGPACMGRGGGCGCCEGRVCVSKAERPSHCFNGGSEAPYVAFNFFFFLVAPCDKVSPLLQSLLFFRT